MIQYVKRQNLDIYKYDTCIENSLQSKMYAFSWYLDIVADNWDVLVLDDYKAVMPIPWCKKLGIKYVYPPFWLLELGIFSLDKTVDDTIFFEILFDKFKLVESRLNNYNIIKSSETFLIKKQMQTLALGKDYVSIFDSFRKDRRKDVNKAKKVNLVEEWEDSPEKLIQLFKDNVGQRTPNIIQKDYRVLEELMQICIEKRVGELLSVYNRETKLVASGFFLKHKNTITILVSSTDFNNRNNGENTYLIDRAIFRYHKNFEIFNFGGSSMKSIADYFLSFGAKTEEYQQIKYNNLPFILKLFKR